jgi:hypothetical protein
MSDTTPESSAKDLLKQIEEATAQAKSATEDSPDFSPEAYAALEIFHKEAERLSALKQRGGKVTNKAQEFLNLITTNPLVPKGYSKNAVTPYFRESHALKVKKILDVMATDRKHNRILECKKFGMVRATLKQFINQGWSYLIERLDTSDRFYATLRSQIDISNHQAGLLLQWTYDEPSVQEGYEGSVVERDFGEEARLKIAQSPEFVNEEPQSSTAPTVVFKDDLVAFIEKGADNTKFERKKLNLKPEQIEWIQSLVTGIPGILVMELNENHIFLAKSMEIWGAQNTAFEGGQ